MHPIFIIIALLMAVGVAKSDPGPTDIPSIRKQASQLFHHNDVRGLCSLGEHVQDLRDNAADQSTADDYVDEITRIDGMAGTLEDDIDFTCF